LPQPADSSFAWLVACWLAAWRLTALLAYEAGPFELLSRLRVALARVGLHGVVTCFHCLALWVSAAVVLLVYEIEARSLLLILAVAGASSMSERLLGGMRPPENGDGE
jgi:hypothetical protein